MPQMYAELTLAALMPRLEVIQMKISPNVRPVKEDEHLFTEVNDICRRDFSLGKSGKMVSFYVQFHFLAP